MYQQRLFESSAIYFGIGAIFCLLTYLGLNKRQRAVVVERLRSIKHRYATAHTPPRSVSPENFKRVDRLARNNEYLHIFPPSTRHLLGQVMNEFSSAQKEVLGDLQFKHDQFEQSLLGWEEDFSSANPDKYICSGFTVREIKALGDFPDYATLCEVPRPEPYHSFDINKALPRPYRPFRWGYHQTMSLSRLEPNWWLELENTYTARIAQRRQLYLKHGAGVLQWRAGTELACKELMEMSLQFLCARYPQYFELHSQTTDRTKTIFVNRILGTNEVVQDKHPLLILLENVPEDFAVMMRNPSTGYYHFRAGVICSALGWNLATKIDKELHEIHAPVPDYKEKMQFSMDRFFAYMPVDKPIQRGSWGFEVDQPLYMPPGDPHEKYRDSQDEKVPLERIHLRVDWQTLRRLPLSGSIVFNFKAVFTPIIEFADEPGLPAVVAKVCREGKKQIMVYKNTWHTEHVVLPAMDWFAKEQIEKGLVEQDWEVQTLPEAPFYAGWEEKWHKQQGF